MDEQKLKMVQTCVQVLGAYIDGIAPSNNVGPVYGDMMRLADTLQEAGWKLLGNGSYGCVLESPHAEGVVFKFGTHYADAALAFAQWARANQHLPHLPVIYAIQKFKHGYVYAMPRYHSAEARSDIHEQRYACERILYGNGDAAECARFPTAVAMREYFDGCVGIDLHSYNVMVDPATDQMVITDPFAMDRTAPEPKEDQQ